MERLLIILSLLFTLPVFGKKFSNHFIEFELPNGWDCHQSGADWFCNSKNEDRVKEAIIIFVGKNRKDSDNLKNYKEYLSEKKNWDLPNGKSQISDPKFVSKRNINQNEWIDSLHLASEVPGFYTRYLAGIKGKTAVAMTFSVHQSVYQDYKEVIDQVLASIKVFGSAYRPGKGVNSAIAKLRNQSGNLNNISAIYADVGDIKVQRQRSRKAKESSGDASFYLLLLFAIGMFVFLRIKKKGGLKAFVKPNSIKKSKGNKEPTEIRKIDQPKKKSA